MVVLKGLVRRALFISVLCGLAAGSPSFAEKADKALKAERQAQLRAERQAAQKAQRAATRPVPKAGELAVDKLAAMTPEQRQKALANLPAERRERLERNLDNFQKLPPQQQERARQRLEMLNSLPQPRQVIVRQSVRQFNQMPADRKQAINRELRAMAPLSDEDRRAYMNTDQFRGRFSPAEQDTVGHLAEILPRN